MSVQLLSLARDEIKYLRKKNEIMSAQLAIVDVFAAAVGLRKNEGGMMSEDALYLIEEELKKEGPRAAKKR